MGFEGTDVIIAHLDDFVLWKIYTMLMISFVLFEECGLK